LSLRGDFRENLYQEVVMALDIVFNMHFFNLLTANC